MSLELLQMFLHIIEDKQLGFPSTNNGLNAAPTHFHQGCDQKEHI